MQIKKDSEFSESLRAIDGARTRGLDLGKVARYQLRHYRIRAGDGNRTHVSSLEGWCSTIELHPHIAVLALRLCFARFNDIEYISLLTVCQQVFLNFFNFFYFIFFPVILHSLYTCKKFNPASPRHLFQTQHFLIS